MFQIKAKLVYNKKVRGRYFNLALKALKIAREATPGQFIEVKISDNYEPLLRRPFSIHRVNSSNIEIIYEAVGKGTEILSKKKTGDYLDVIGPLGNGFDINETTKQRNNETTIIVAGGMGVAPLIFLAEKLAEIQNPKSKIQNLVLIGAKTKSEILCEKEFKKLGCRVKIATDDGSRGFKGKVTDLLKAILRDTQATRQPDNEIYACGPRPMLKEISRISKREHICTQLSLEEHMACGIGACLGCAVKTKEGYRRVCKEGPVFNADEIAY